MRSFNSTSVLPATTYQFIMRVERINLMQGFFVSLAYTISITFDFMEGYVANWSEYPANIVGEIAEGVTGIAVPVMVFFCAKHIRSVILNILRVRKL
ncbi:hypothetical protein ANCCAN_06354 [Ancylostoma caninum]|uniref:Uncharacterized protein n=1 Tax=Ancylostoma caninum TaxID=29170 RepID=A0A368GX33_ANCCA|nr:hypothetical protein ANCCAN_06354 [Ancylostoma caninum]